MGGNVTVSAPAVFNGAANPILSAYSSFTIYGPTPYYDPSAPLWGAVNGQNNISVINKILSLIQTKGGGKIYLRGDWLWNFSEWILPSNTEIEIFGDGIGYTIFTLAAGSNSPIINASNSNRVTIRDMTLDGNGLNNAVSGNYGLYANNPTYLTLEKTRWQNCAGDNIVILGAPSNNEIYKSEIDGYGTHSYNSLNITGGFTNIEKCILTNTSGYAFLLGSSCIAKRNNANVQYGGLYAIGNETTFEDNDVTYSGTGTPTLLVTRYNTSNNRLIKNRIYCNGKAAAINIGPAASPNIATCVGTIVDGNYIENCNLDGILTGVSNTNGDTAYGNIVINNVIINAINGPALEDHWIKTTMENNIVIGCDSVGLYGEGVYSSYKNNTLILCQRNPSGDYSSAMKIAGIGCEADENTILDTGQGTTYQHMPAILINNDQLTAMTGNRARNNTLVDTRTTNYMTHGIIIIPGSGDTIDDTILENNTIKGYTIAPVYDSGGATNTQFLKNPGYNPIGISSIVAGASPYTYTAGTSPVVLYVSGGAVTSITKNGINIGITNGQIYLLPNESIIITYTAAPTIVADIQ